MRRAGSCPCGVWVPRLGGSALCRCGHSLADHDAEGDCTVVAVASPRLELVPAKGTTVRAADDFRAPVNPEGLAAAVLERARRGLDRCIHGTTPPDACERCGWPLGPAVCAAGRNTPIVTEGAAGGPTVTIRDAGDSGWGRRAIRGGVRSLANAAPLSPGAREVTEDPVTRRPTHDDVGIAAAPGVVWPPEIAAEIAAAVRRVKLTLVAAGVCDCDVCLSFAVSNWRDVAPFIAPAINGRRHAGHGPTPRQKTHHGHKNFPRHASSVTPPGRGKK